MATAVSSIKARCLNTTQQSGMARTSTPVSKAVSVVARLPVSRSQALKKLTCAVAAPSMPAAETAEEMSVEDLKMLLQDTLWGTDRGLSASSDARAEINEIITQLEANNPTPLPNEAVEMLNGSWKLAYTSNSELMALLALGRLPLVTVGDIIQSVDSESMSVENRVQLAVPFSRTSLAATANFEVRSPKLLQLKFEQGQVATPELLSDFELPSYVEVLGNTVDLSPLQPFVQPLEGPVKSIISSVGSLLSGAPDLKFDITSPKASTWLLNTFLDGDLRISRGDGGSIFVMIKQSSTSAISELPDLMEPMAEGSDDEDPNAPSMASYNSTSVVEPSAIIEEDVIMNSDDE